MAAATAAVTAEELPSTVGSPGTEEKLETEMSSLNIVADPVQAVPPHRSHDPQYNQKRTDPFQFGSRYLNEEDDVFEFNAWDHVETDDAYKEYAEQQYEMQRQSPVSDFDRSESRRVFPTFHQPGVCDDLHNA